MKWQEMVDRDKDDYKSGEIKGILARKVNVRMLLTLSKDISMIRIDFSSVKGKRRKKKVAKQLG